MSKSLEFDSMNSEAMKVRTDEIKKSIKKVIPNSLDIPKILFCPKKYEISENKKSTSESLNILTIPLIEVFEFIVSMQS